MKQAALIILFAILFCSDVKAQLWTTVGSGGLSNTTGEALAVYNGALYVGGSFSTAGGVAANNIAKWNGSAWSAVGAGVSGTSGIISVQELAVFNGYLYAGGNFSSAGGVPAMSIARWNGTTWASVGTGLSGNNPYVQAFAVHNGELYVGGSFSMAGGVAANNIAKWNGTSWSAVGAGINGTVRVLAVYNNELYATGYFDTSGGANPFNYIAKWNGTAWSAVGSGLDFEAQALAVYNNDLYVGGPIYFAGGTPVNRIAKWNGTAWSPVGTGMNNDVTGLAVINGELYAGGKFTMAGGVSANRVAKLNGTAWTAVGSGMANGFIKSFELFNSNVYAAGWFSNPNGIAKYALSTSTQDIFKAKDIAIYPNPVADLLHIRNSTGNIGLLRIYDQAGKKVIEQNVSGKDTQVDMRALAPGIYFLNVAGQGVGMTIRK